MRRTRLFALTLVSFVGALLAPGTFINRALVAVVCTVFSFNSTLCTVNLAKSSDRVVAATPPAVERNISDWLVQRDPGEFDDAPSVPQGIRNKLSLYGSCQEDVIRFFKEKLVRASLSIWKRRNN